MTNEDREARLATLVREPRVPEDVDPTHGEINSVRGIVQLVRTANEIAGPVRSAVEVGSYMGVSTEALLLLVDRVVAVDPWVGTAGEAKFQAFCERTRHYSHLEVRRAASPYAAQLFADESFDLLYVDADHHYAEVKQDLLAWIPKVRKGGWIAGHDYFAELIEGGVIPAVNEILGVPQHIFSDSSYLVRKV